MGSTAANTLGKIRDDLRKSTLLKFYCCTVVRGHSINKELCTPIKTGGKDIGCCDRDSYDKYYDGDKAYTNCKKITMSKQNTNGKKKTNRKLCCYNTSGHGTKGPDKANINYMDRKSVSSDARWMCGAAFLFNASWNYVISIWGIEQLIQKGKFTGASSLRAPHIGPGALDLLDWIQFFLFIQLLIHAILNTIHGIMGWFIMDDEWIKRKGITKAKGGICGHHPSAGWLKWYAQSVKLSMHHNALFCPISLLLTAPSLFYYVDYNIDNSIDFDLTPIIVTTVLYALVFITHFTLFNRWARYSLEIIFYRCPLPSVSNRTNYSKKPLSESTTVKEPNSNSRLLNLFKPERSSRSDTYPKQPTSLGESTSSTSSTPNLVESTSSPISSALYSSEKDWDYRNDEETSSSSENLRRKAEEKAKKKEQKEASAKKKEKKAAKKAKKAAKKQKSDMFMDFDVCGSDPEKHELEPTDVDFDAYL